MAQFIGKLSKYLCASEVLIPKKQQSLIQLISNKIIIHKILKQCSNKFKQFNNSTYRQQIAFTYLKFHGANNSQDNVDAFRYLSLNQYMRWKSQRPFNTYPDIYDIKLIRGRKFVEEDGQWFQFGVRFTHLDLQTKKPIYKTHVIQRKIDEPYGVARKWYFSYFQN